MKSAVEVHGISASRACGLVEINRISFYYVATLRDDSTLREALREGAARYRRWGYRHLMIVIRRQGYWDNHKRVYRIYLEEGLQVRTRKRKRTSKWRGEKPNAPDHVNARWSMDFVHDATAQGRKLRMLTILDDYTRRCLRIEVDTSLTGERVARTLDQVMEFYGKPDSLLMDNGSEFTGKALDEWAYRNAVKLQFIEPWKPTQNGFIESFNGTLRNECLNENWFSDLQEAKNTIETWRRLYNQERPHSSLKYQTSEKYADMLTHAILPRGDQVSITSYREILAL